MKAILCAIVFVSLGAVSPEDVLTVEINCTAAAIWGEARGEPYEGKLLVAQALMNRAEAAKTDVCTEYRRDGQFDSWANQRPVFEEFDAWRESRLIAGKMLTGQIKPDKCENVTHFYAPPAAPSWRHKLKDVCRIGEHVYGRL